ncbi:TonB-dependent receptor domain-containing protein [Novosphingobium sp. P6W]|uniref:TonB-dependent receptor domain-containing protein n=1 Tax=Novosphingobium sp. P6W TaxID=1609758 RepID=UPI001F06E452|nr:TonB-dependent receptor [Novosphingobium sp. P6W]
MAALLAATTMTAAATPAIAQVNETYRFDLPTQDLGDALRTVATKAGLEVYASAEDVNGISAPSLQGDMTAREAVDHLLAGTGLVARIRDGSIVIRGRSGGLAAVGGEDEILVTGSRIKGVLPTARVSTVTANDIQRAGQTDLGEVFRSLPMNFSGGQNPGIGTTQGSANVNVNGASSVNLLGLGPNATLTLLNGNRMSYTGVNAAVDVSAIPAAAVDRIEIVADGASAIYGADAVAGVVNIRLKRDFQGLSVMGRLAGSTDGGGFQQQYNAVGGYRWSSGSVLAAYDFTDNDPVKTSQRSYATNMASDATLYPSLRRHNALVSLEQEIGDRLSAKVDMVFKDSEMLVLQGYARGQSYLANGADGRSSSRSFSIAPTLEWAAGADWTVRVNGAYSFDNTRNHSNVYSAGRVTQTGYRRYDNSSYAIELGAEGEILTLPAGAARMAVGGGFRRIGFDVVSRNGAATAIDFERHRNNEFGYAELFVPLLSAEQQSSLGRSLALTAAFRYERNTGVGSVSVPKLGITYAPVEGLTLKGSWGRSFRVPTFYQQYSGIYAVLLPTTGYGSGFPPGANFIVLTGANPDMKPERTESWTLGAELAPAANPNLAVSAGYFHFRYRDRVASPVTSIVGLLDNPLYASMIKLKPTAAEQQASFANATLGLQNAVGLPYDPTSVVAIADILDRNVARQTYSGIDASVRYSLPVSETGRLALNLAATWLRSSQQLLPGAPSTELAGTVLNPPRFKTRAFVTYTQGALSISGAVNLSSKLTDRRRTAVYRIDGLSTFDLAAQVDAGSGFELGASVSNMLNQKPDVIFTGAAYDTAFDTTNFSALGRVVAISLRKTW